jgi:uncharacterized membrane protein
MRLPVSLIFFLAMIPHSSTLQRWMGWTVGLAFVAAVLGVLLGHQRGSLGSLA